MESALATMPGTICYSLLPLMNLIVPTDDSLFLMILLGVISWRRKGSEEEDELPVKKIRRRWEQLGQGNPALRGTSSPHKKKPQL